jgi:hypothetical protein
MTANSSFRCPKCGGKMRRYERSGIVVEQCEGCRGIFLDYGELERLIDAEGGGWSGRVGPPGAESPYDGDPAHERLEGLRDLFGRG